MEPAEQRAKTEEDEGVDYSRLEEGSSLLNAVTPKAEQEEEEEPPFKKRTVRLQSVAYILAHVFCAIDIILVSIFAHMLSGLSWNRAKPELIFNWHPLMMVFAFCFMTTASLSFRMPAFDRPTRKMLHGVQWGVSIIFAVVGLVAVFRARNVNNSNKEPKANMVSLHSWVAAAVILLYLGQFFAGVFSFAFPFPGITGDFKANMLLLHRIFGPLIYVGAVVTILLGLQDNDENHHCAYMVHHADLIPFRHFTQIPSICMMSHWLALSIVATALCTMFTLQNLVALHPKAA